MLFIFLILTAYSVAHDCNLKYPRQYVTYKLLPNEKITFDGKLDEPAWTRVPFSEKFLDIQGPSQPEPYYETRMKMRWDDDYLYVGGYLVEPFGFANLTINNSIIFNDNDFEVFIDPDGSNTFYKELEMNARNLNWNLLLCRTYDNGGPAVCNFTTPGMCDLSAPQYGVPYWDIAPNLPSAVYVEGKLNDPSVGTSYWTIEIGIPIRDYLRYEQSTYPVKPGDYWRIDFSRVENAVYIHEQPDGQLVYWKNTSVPVQNWVWQPTWIIDMHVPETWGYIQFASGPINQTKLVQDPQWPVRDALMQVYYALTSYFSENKDYTTSLSTLVSDGLLPSYVAEGTCSSIPTITITNKNNVTGFVVTSGLGSMWGSITEDRHISFK